MQCCPPDGTDHWTSVGLKSFNVSFLPCLLANTMLNNSGFGFVLFTREDTGSWLMDVVDVNGDVRNRCRLAARALSCDQQLGQAD